VRSYRWLFIIGGLIAIAYFSGALENSYNWMQENFRDFTGAEVWKEDEEIIE